MNWRNSLRWSNISSKKGYNCLFLFLALFWAYVGQPDSHIGWGKLMPFASINLTNPRTNLWNFAKIAQLLGVVEKQLRHTLLQRTLYSKETHCIVTSCSKEQFVSYWLVTVCSLTNFTPQHTLPPGMFFSLRSKSIFFWCISYLFYLTKSCQNLSLKLL